MNKLGRLGTIEALSQKTEEVSQKIEDLKHINSDLEVFLPYIIVSNTNLSTVHLSDSRKNNRLRTYTFNVFKIHVALMCECAIKGLCNVVEDSFKSSRKGSSSP
jgi:hypothetical protein